MHILLWQYNIFSICRQASEICWIASDFQTAYSSMIVWPDKYLTINHWVEMSWPLSNDVSEIFSSIHQTHYDLNMHINILTTYLRYYSRIEPLGNISYEIWGLLGNAGLACGGVSECYGPQNAVSDITSILQSPYIST